MPRIGIAGNAMPLGVNLKIEHFIFPKVLYLPKPLSINVLYKNCARVPLSHPTEPIIQIMNLC